MKKILVLSITILFLNNSFAQKWTPQSGSVKFKITMLGMSVDGSFKGLKANVDFNPENPANASIYATVDANTVFTDNSLRDKHLKEKDEFFEVAKYPTLSLKSTSITKNGNDYIGTFDLTIKNITKSVKIPFTFTKNTNKGTFAAKFEINRKDWKIGGNTLGMSEKVSISLSLNVQE